MAADFATLICYYLQDYEAMLEESKDLKPGFRYSQARTLFEDDPRWKVTKIELMWQTCAHKGSLPSYHDPAFAFFYIWNQCPELCISAAAVLSGHWAAVVPDSCSLQAIASVDREEMFVEHMKERERRKRAEEKAARKRKLQDFRELLERSSGIKVCSSCHHYAVYSYKLQSTQGAYQVIRMCQVHILPCICSAVLQCPELRM